MDEFTDAVQAGARDLAAMINPTSASSVRARGDQLRRRRIAGLTAVTAAGAVIVGGGALTLGGADGGQATGVPDASRTSTSRPTATSESSPSVSPSLSSSVSSSQPSPSSTATGSSKGTPKACDAAHLAITSSPWTGRTGHSIGIFVFQNKGSTTCRISGYPRVDGVDDHGVKTTEATNSLSGWSPPLFTSVPTVDIPPGGLASAGVSWLHGANPGEKCAIVAAFEVTPPSGGAPTKISTGEPQGTPIEGPACALFEIKPITTGVDADYYYPPYTPPTPSNP